MKSTALAIVVAGALIAGAVFFTGVSSNTTDTGPANNVSVVDGKQIIEIRARGGYQPRVSTAKAGLPTIIRFQTNGTFDCSSSVRIPSLGISKLLPQTGTTDIDLGLAQAGKLQGMCGMGMYFFEVNFNS